MGSNSLYRPSGKHITLAHCSTCSHQRKTCLGQPCTTATSTPPTTVSVITTLPPETAPPTCIGGWTEWRSQDNQKSGTDSDIEPLPTVNQLVSNSSLSSSCNPSDLCCANFLPGLFEVFLCSFWQITS
jgi:hypothetical protein